ncbi:MAG: hypothetical protein B7Z55_19755, partial [Planctomycetales bacterium 12-60-4]
MLSKFWEMWAFANADPGWIWVGTGYFAPIGEWTHVAVTYDQGAVRTYADGRLVHTYLGAGSIGDAASDLNELWIGNRQGFSQGFIGAIDDVQVWNIARSVDQVRDDMSGNPGPVAGLQGHWTFDESVGTRARDSSGFGNDGVFGSRVAGGAPTHHAGRIHVATFDDMGEILSLVAKSSVPEVAVELDGNEVFVYTLKNFVGTATITLTEALQDGVLVFADQDGDNVLDAGEVSSYTDANGEYALRGIVTTPSEGAIVEAAGDAVPTGGASGDTRTRISTGSGFIAPYTDLVSRTEVRINLTLNGQSLQALFVTPEMVAGNATVGDLANDLQQVLVQRGLDEIKVTAQGERLRFETVGIGADESLEVRVAAVTTAREEDYAFNFSTFSGYVLQRIRFRPVVVTEGGLGFAAGA